MSTVSLWAGSSFISVDVWQSSVERYVVLGKDGQESRVTSADLYHWQETGLDDASQKLNIPTNESETDILTRNESPLCCFNRAASTKRLQWLKTNLTNFTVCWTSPLLVIFWVLLQNRHQASEEHQFHICQSQKLNTHTCTHKMQCLIYRGIIHLCDTLWVFKINRK